MTAVSSSASTVRDIVVKCKATVEELRVALAAGTTTPEVLAELGGKVESLEAELASSLLGGGDGVATKTSSSLSSVGGNIIVNVIPSMSSILNTNVAADIVSDVSKTLLSSSSSAKVLSSTGAAADASSSAASAAAIGSKRPRNDALPSANMFDDEIMDAPQRPTQGGRGAAAAPVEPAEITSSLRSLTGKERSMFLPPSSSSTSSSGGDAAASRQGYFFGLDTMVAPLPFTLNTVTLKKPVVASSSSGGPSSSSGGAFNGGRGAFSGGRGTFRGRRGGGGGGGRGGRR